MYSSVPNKRGVGVVLTIPVCVCVCVCVFVCVFVCVCVCLFDTYLLLGNCKKVDILYMVRSRIYREVFLSIFGVGPPNRSDAIVRKPDTCRKKHDFFRGFRNN